jgi:hypothetical protein
MMLPCRILGYNFPDSPPFISTTDAEPLGRLRGRLVGDYELKLDLLPQPWTGNVNTAEVFVLALNPGFRTEDHADLQNRDYAEQWRLALSVQTRTAFYFLDPAFRHTGGFLWWHRRMRDLIEVVGLDAVAQRVDTLIRGGAFYIVSGAQCIETPAAHNGQSCGRQRHHAAGPAHDD